MKKETVQTSPVLSPVLIPVWQKLMSSNEQKVTSHEDKQTINEQLTKRSASDYKRQKINNHPLIEIYRSKQGFLAALEATLFPLFVI